MKDLRGALFMKIKTNKALNKELGPNNIRAIFDTVINPLLQSLTELELKFLRENNWTWRSHYSRLEFIRPIESYLDSSGKDNIILIKSKYPQIKTIMHEHDHKVDILIKCCSELQTIIQETPELKQLYLETTDSSFLSALGKAISDLFGTIDEGKNLKLLAEYIVNNRKDNIPNWYTISPLWNKYKEKYLTLLEKPEIIRVYQKSIKAGDNLYKCTQKLIDVLQNLRLELSFKSDVPPAVAEPSNKYD